MRPWPSFLLGAALGLLGASLAAVHFGDERVASAQSALAAGIAFSFAMEQWVRR